MLHYKKNSSLTLVSLIVILMIFSSINYAEEIKSSEEVLTIGFDPSLPPYQFIEDDIYQGFFIELSQKIFDEIGESVVFVPMSLETSMQAFEKNEIDGILGMRYDSTLNEAMAFSDSLVNATISIVMLNDNEMNIKESIGSLPLVIAVERNSAEYEYVTNIKKANFNTTFDQQAVVELMLMGRADMIIGVKHVAEYMLEGKHLTDQYAFNDSYVTSVDYYLAIDHERIRILDKFNDALRDLKLSGGYELLYNKWINDKTIENQRRVRHIIEIMGITLLAALLASGVIGWISLKLKKTIDEKTSELSNTNLQLQRKIIEIKNTNELKNLIFESSPRSIVIFDNEGCVLAMNEPARELCHLEEMPIGVPIMTLAPLDAMLGNRLDSVLKEGASYVNKEFSYHRNDRLYYYRFVIYPLVYSKGGIITFEETTEEKLLKERVAEREKNKALIQIVSGIAHEIRNPMTSIKTYATLLPHKKDNEAFQKQIAEVIPNEVDRVNVLIENLIDYVKPKPKNIEKINVEELIKSSFMLFEPTLNKHSIDIEMTIEESTEIAADKDQMKQVIINLILNAIDAVIEMRKVQTIEVDDRIAVYAKKINGYQIIEVIDNGIGMTKEEQASMFDLFYTTKRKGSGIGMALCKQMIEENHGTIVVLSEKYQGTTIRLSFGGES